MAVPDSSNPAALGYSHAADIPFDMGFIRNHYVGRTFIEPDQGIRDFGVRIKLNPSRSAVNGKRIVLVDDSIVRGTTARKIIKMLHRCGAKEIHFRVASPPIINSCHYGIDTPNSEKLIAHNLNVEEIREFIGVDSLAYLTIPAMLEATGCPKDHFCTACFRQRVSDADAQRLPDNQKVPSPCGPQHHPLRGRLSRACPKRPKPFAGFPGCLSLSCFFAEPPLRKSPGTWMRFRSRRKLGPPRAFPSRACARCFMRANPGKARRHGSSRGMARPRRRKAKKTPAMVLVHGGGGTAFAEWVRLWTSRGYAAIAMDTCGCVPKGTYGHWERHEHGGPAGWGGFDQIDQPVEDQWTCHAIADVLLAHSLIRSMPGVDPARTGITGISWGGYLTCIAAGVDKRFLCAAPVYGCGFLGDNSVWSDALAKMPPETSAKWLGLWDPSVYLPGASMPMLWVTGTNDFAYPMDSLQKSYRLPGGPRTLCIRIRMPHSHGGAGENPAEIRAFADNNLRGQMPLAKVNAQGQEPGKAWAVAESQYPIVSAELIYTKAEGKWQDRLWESMPATLDAKAPQFRAEAALPEGVTVFYFNFTGETGLAVSSEHETPAPQ